MKHYFRKRRDYSILSSLLPIIILILVLVVFTYAARQVGQTQSEQEIEILNRALNRSITQCYALEGAYPANLAYLQDHYGLTYDSEHYFIDYQYIGSNLKPNVIIIERK